MTTATVVFLAIGGVGVLLLALSLVGLGAFDFDGPVPLEAVAAGVGGFGFAAAITSALTGAGAGAGGALAGAAAIGAVAAVPSGWLALRLARAAADMRTDATPVRSDLLGMLGVVVTPIPADGYGEVRVTLGGQPVKLNASADAPVAYGVEVFVVAAPSETSVVVEPVSSPPAPPVGD